MACDVTCRNVPSVVEDYASSFGDSDNTTACSSTCRFYLLDYLERCLPAIFVDFRDAYSLLCGISDMPIINNSCQLDTNITDCISSLEDSTSATSGGDIAMVVIAVVVIAVVVIA